MWGRGDAGPIDAESVENMQRSQTQQAIVPRLFSVADTARHLRVSAKTVRRWINEGNLPVHRLGRQIRIAEQDLVAFIRQCRQA
jgi:excisionase family DNA binding protein